MSTTVGITQIELLSLIGILSSIFDDVVASVTTPKNARAVVEYHLNRLSRYAYGARDTGQHKIFPNEEHFLEINEKYRDNNKTHAWSMVLQMRPGSKVYKVLHAIPVPGASVQPVNVSETLRQQVAPQQQQQQRPSPQQMSQIPPGALPAAMRPPQQRQAPVGMQLGPGQGGGQMAGQRQMGQMPGFTPGQGQGQRQNPLGMLDEMSSSMLSRQSHGGYNNNMGPDGGQGDISEIALGQMR